MLERTASAPERSAPRTSILLTTAALATPAEASTPKAAIEETPADSATADTAFKNFEPAFISNLTFSRCPSAGGTRLRPSASFYLLFLYKQARPLISVYFASHRGPIATLASKQGKHPLKKTARNAPLADQAADIVPSRKNHQAENHRQADAECNLLCARPDRSAAHRLYRIKHQMAAVQNGNGHQVQ